MIKLRLLPIYLCCCLTACQTPPQVKDATDEVRMHEWAFDSTTLTPVNLPTLTARQWEAEMRPQIIDYFTSEVYGALPPADRLAESAEVREAPTSVHAGLGWRTQVALTLVGADATERHLDLLMYYPQTAVDQPVPVLLNLNFLGNQSVDPDPKIYLSRNDVYTGRAAERGIANRRPTAGSRGIRSGRLPVEYLLRQGLAVITAGYQDVLPDHDGAARPLLQDFYGMDPTATGAISAWARGYHWLADYALRQTNFRVANLVATGHSRLGKAVLWAAATDQRISGVHVNNSGCGGAALFRRARGETIADITGRFPHWFRDTFHNWSGRDHLVPYDQEWLLAAIAPRKLLVASATEDQWADPAGEFAALRASLPAFRAFAPSSALPVAFPPARAGHAYGVGPVAYHLRAGPHDLQRADFVAFVALLKR